MRRPLLAAVVTAALLVLVLPGCTNARPTPDPTGEPATPETGAAEGTPAGSAGGTAEGSGFVTSTNTFTITNDTGVEICRVFVNLSRTPRLASQLEEGRTVPAGTSFTFLDVRSNQYDVLLEDCDEQPLIGAYGVYLGIEPVEWTVGPLVDLTFENEASEDVCGLRLSPIFATSWGPNLLGEEAAVEAGASTVIEQYPAGTYDLLVEPCESEEASEVFQIELGEGMTYTFTGE